MSGRFRLPVEQGATLRFSFVLSSDTGPTDLTGATARMQIRERPGTVVLAEASTANGGITMGGSPGQVSVHLTDAQTDAITVKRARYDLEITFPSGDVKRVLEGRVACSLAITQDTP